MRKLIAQYHGLSAFMPMMLILMLAAAGSRADKVTQDPNKPGNQAEKPENKLLQKISYEARQKPVRLVLEELSKSTGVRLYAGRNESDWQVRDRRMNAFLKDTSLSDAMSAISRVMKFRWKRIDDPNGPSYRLYLEKTDGLAADDRRLAEDKQRAEARKKYIEDCKMASDLTDDQLEQLKEEDPVQYFYAKIGLSGALCSIMNEIPGASGALTNGTELAVQISQLSPAAKRALLEFAEAVRKTIAAGEKSPILLESASIENLEKMTFKINRASLYLRPNSVLGIIRITKDDGHGFGYPIIDSQNQAEQAEKRAMIRCMDENRPFTQDEIRRAVEAQNELSFLDSPRKHIEDPALCAMAKLNAKNAHLDDILFALAKASGCAVISDSFAGSDMNADAPAREMKLQSLLDWIADTYECNWGRHSAIIELRDRNWVKKRALQIPDAWLDRWRQALNNSKMLDIDSLAEIAQFSSEQLAENIEPDAILGKTNAEAVVNANRNLLLLYVSLTAVQRDALFSKSGLGIDSANGEQWKLLLGQMGPKYSTGDLTPMHVILAAGKKTSGNRLLYSFRVSGDNIQPVVWDITAPMRRSNP